LGPATWPAIINVDTHNRLEAIVRGRERGPKQRPARKHLLTGYLRCHCGARMVTAPNDRGVTRYVCPPRGNGRGAACTSVVSHHADDTARAQVLKYLDSKDFAKALERARRFADDADKTLEKLRFRLARDQARLAEIGDMFADGEIDRAEYRRVTARVQERIDDAERKMARLDKTGPSFRLEGQGELLRRAWDAMTLEERRDVIGAVAEHFVIEPATRPVNVFRPERVRPVWRF